MNRRLINEIKKSSKITDNYYNEDENILTFIYEDEKVVSLKIPREYPFRPPTDLNINFIPIVYYKLGNKKMLNKYFNKMCLCCSTILCKDNWSPYKNLEEICDEYNVYKNIINSSIVFKYIEKTDSLPDDVIRIIVSYFKLRIDK